MLTTLGAWLTWDPWLLGLSVSGAETWLTTGGWTRGFLAFLTYLRLPLRGLRGLYTVCGVLDLRCCKSKLISEELFDDTEVDRRLEGSVFWWAEARGFRFLTTPLLLLDGRGYPR